MVLRGSLELQELVLEELALVELGSASVGTPNQLLLVKVDQLLLHHPKVVVVQ